jgi:hypothetical protein
MNPRYLLIAMTATVVACQQTDAVDDEAGVASQGSDSVQITNDEAATLALAVNGSDGAQKPAVTITAEQAAANAAAHVGGALTPSTCHSSTVNGATATYTFNDCSGPFGLVHLTGTLTVVYSVDEAGVHAHGTANDFNVNQSTLDIDATATYTVGASGKTLTVETHGEGTGPLGNTIAHQGSYTVTLADTCHTLNGSWSTTANGTTRSTTVTNLTRCKGFCPAAGGTVTHTFKGGQTLTLTYTGGASATWTVGARMGTLQLTCTPMS